MLLMIFPNWEVLKSIKQPLINDGYSNLASFINYLFRTKILMKFTLIRPLVLRVRVACVSGKLK